MSRKAVLFDLDNTLINRKEAFHVFSERLLDQFFECGAEAREEMLDFIRIADRNGYRNKRELFEEIKGKYVLKDPAVSVEDLLKYWFSEFFKCTVLMDAAKEVLDSIKDQGYVLGLITNGSVHTQYRKLDTARLREYFEVIVISDEVNLKKPDQRIFELALHRLGADAQTSWYVGDHPVNDVHGARQAGLQPVWFEGFMEWEKHVPKPAHVIRHLHDLLPILAISTYSR
ncbi:HAD family hydrolase [Paenibacillus senegalensis]|uniref:HAD family hydrolase n=1 Tax=Paenibacillus senegalensis TaxID=1465766 RepID=UPI0003002232|nr:HAD family hydrolase [Paenibacillus senegalensis]